MGLKYSSLAHEGAVHYRLQGLSTMRQIMVQKLSALFSAVAVLDMTD